MALKCAIVKLNTVNFRPLQPLLSCFLAFFSFERGGELYFAEVAQLVEHLTENQRGCNHLERLNLVWSFFDFKR